MERTISLATKITSKVMSNFVKAYENSLTRFHNLCLVALFPGGALTVDSNMSRPLDARH